MKMCRLDEKHFNFVFLRVGLDMGEGWNEGGTKFLPGDIFFVLCFILEQTKDIIT